jgi:hypothetical protein
VSDTDTEEQAAEEQGKGKSAKKPKQQPKQAAAAKGKSSKAGARGKAGQKQPVGKHARAGKERGAEPSVAGHPRARAMVRSAKGWGGLVAFVVAAYLSFNAGVPIYVVGVRALVAGAAGYLLAWACSVTVWRHLLVAELRVAAERHEAARAERQRAAETAAAAKRS